MSEKVSILTLRLTAEEAAQMEVLKSITGKKSGSEAIKYIVKEYPRFCAHYKQEAREKGELQRKYPDKKKVVVYDLEHNELPAIYGFEDQVPVNIFAGKCQIDFSGIYSYIEFLFEKESKKRRNTTC